MTTKLHLTLPLPYQIKCENVKTTCMRAYGFWVFSSKLRQNEADSIGVLMEGLCPLRSSVCACAAAAEDVVEEAVVREKVGKW